MSASGFANQELKIRDIAYQTFITKEFSLKTFENKWPKAGFEGWVIGELLIQFEIRGMNPQKKQNPDLLVNNLKIEIKGCAHSKYSRDAGWLIDDYTKHSNRDILHLWVFSKTNILEHLEAFFKLNAIIHDDLDLAESGWRVMISKQTETSPKPLVKLTYRDWKNKQTARSPTKNAWMWLEPQLAAAKCPICNMWVELSMNDWNRKKIPYEVKCPNGHDILIDRFSFARKNMKRPY